MEREACKMVEGSKRKTRPEFRFKTLEDASVAVSEMADILDQHVKLIETMTKSMEMVTGIIVSLEARWKILTEK